MLPDCLLAEGERRCRRLLAGATARLRARPASAAVLVPLCLVRGVPALLYTLRSSRLAGRHKGDVRYTGRELLALQREYAEPRRQQGPWARRLASPSLGFRLCKIGLGRPCPPTGYGEESDPCPSRSLEARPGEHHLGLGLLSDSVTLSKKAPSWRGFPGGKCDPADQDVVHTALRETREELGLAVSEEQVWGLLRPVYDRQRATVVPVLAGVGPLDLQSLRPNPEEVDEVFVLPLAHLLQTQNQGYTHFCRGGHFSYTLPVFLHGPHRVWGLTAVITEFTLQLLAPSTYQSVLATPELPRG
ncbi:mitochondrial coenzyme A diphosphatase NUDT8 isoform X1 [Nycticebus coucang]|uniref:mitochondrial coenzyme A diphosphatase NUDT8 isoform X1 n=1 Tax=Nycticebus coucang TaxID=9470 RepID=UPI00234C203E|nr:mitochondrial coenzyme A diphosphatase NUDT8 isoform X1 [Nycticebus coucang]